ASDGFLGYARDARIGVAANRTSENIAAQLSSFRRVVGNGAGVATVAEFVAKVFACELLLTNLGSLSFDRQFGPATLEAMFGPAVVTGFEGQQTVGVSTVNGSAVFIAYKPYATRGTTRENAERPRPSMR